MDTFDKVFHDILYGKEPEEKEPSFEEVLGRKEKSPRGRKAFLTDDTLIRVGARHLGNNTTGQIQRLLGDRKVSYAKAVELVARSDIARNRRSAVDPETYARQFLSKHAFDRGYFDIA